MNRVMMLLCGIIVVLTCAVGGLLVVGTDGLELEGDDCTQSEVYAFDDDCGYYNSSGVFVFYHWVTPGRGGSVPEGQHARPPRNTKVTKPTYTGRRSSNTTRLSPPKATTVRTTKISR